MSTVLPAVNSSPVMLGRTAVSGDLANTTATESQDRFLKLLVTQMRNQDPLNPMDNAQVTTQLAQISTVGGIDKLNGSLQRMASAMAAAGSLQNASLVGRSVLIEGDLARFDGASPVLLGAGLAEKVDSFIATIINGEGRAVRRLVYDNGLPQGTSTFAWDGRNDAGDLVRAGDYTLRVEAKVDGKSVRVSPLLGGHVESVSVFGADSMLNLRGLGAVDVSQIRRID